jgi:hypothetical protein
MTDPIDRRLEAVFELYGDLAQILDADLLRRSLPVPSNPIGMQLWCVVGARETWARAMESAEWGPFGCSITRFSDTQDEQLMRAKLAASAAEFRRAAAEAPLMDRQVDLKLGLLEHENQHLGQLLRYLLGLGVEPPPSWKRRFSL